MENKQNEAIDLCWDIADEYEVEEKLSQIYESIPSGDCVGCGSCCHESVPLTFFELMRVDEYLKENGLSKELAHGVVHYYFNELTRRDSCPFLNDDNRCRIYDVRPLTCRVYGHMTKEADQEGYEGVLSSNKETQEYFKNKHNILIPDDVVSYKIPYCEAFEVSEKMTKEDREKIEMQVLNLDLYFVMEDIIEPMPFSLGLIHGIMYQIAEPEELANLRIVYCKESIEKQEKMLDEYSGKLIKFYQNFLAY